jgi:hypothetical protein
VVYGTAEVAPLRGFRRWVAVGMVEGSRSAMPQIR